MTAAPIPAASSSLSSYLPSALTSLFGLQPGSVGAGGAGAGPTVAQPVPALVVANEDVSLYARIRHIHHALLRHLDPALYEHLEKHQVFPQLYLIRWLRVLFAHDLAIDQVMVVWDSLIASRFAMVNTFCVALMSHLRSALLSTEGADLLDILSHCPPVPDARLVSVIELARRLDSDIYRLLVRQGIQTSPPPPM